MGRGTHLQLVQPLLVLLSSSLAHPLSLSNKLKIRGQLAKLRADVIKSSQGKLSNVPNPHVLNSGLIVYISSVHIHNENAKMLNEKY